MSQQRYLVTAEYLKDGHTTIVRFDDRETAERHAAMLRKNTFGQAIINVGQGPLYRVCWRDRVSGETGIADSGRTKSRAENIAECLDMDYPKRDHWIEADDD
jgi:hypothetical protein